MSIEIIKILENDRELLYEFVKAMNNNGFFGQYSIKGNILLHLLQYNLIKNGNLEFIRLTKDIDMAMYSFKEKPTKEKVLSLLKDINIEGSQIVEVEIVKEPNEFRTAWNLKCYKKYGRRKLQKVLNIDIDSKGFKNEYVKIYNIGDQKFYGSTIEKMATDKIRVISTNSLKNRVKDIFDLSILLKLGFDSSKALSNARE